MPLKFGPRVKETTTTTGTGTVTLAGAVSGFQAFSAVCSNADTIPYYLLDANGTGWEEGIGTWATGGTLARTVVTGSSNSGSAITLSSGTHTVICSLPAIFAQRGGNPSFVDKGNSGTSTQTCDVSAGKFQKITNTGAHTFAFSNWPASGQMGELMVIYVNPGANAVTWPTVSWKKPDGTTTTTFSSSGIVLQSSGVNFFYFFTVDGGTTVYGSAL